MNITYANQRWLVAAAATIVACIGAESATAQPGSNDTRPELEVLTRGPVHEAFAETITFDPQPGVVVPETPPADIEELPPENRPEGSNVSWIPGYWAWDDDSSDFLWVSGTWRVLPPGRQWVPGYWGETRQGSQWTSGYWADAGQTEVEYLPEPPETVESGPNVAASSENDVWIPGSWVWQQNQYSWRPGFWSEGHENWVWIPAHHQWAPRGYVSVDGYWDHTINRRGVLFAPVNFNRNAFGRRGFSYTPSTAIDLGVFASHLFLRPNYGHYYFGDYYGSRYANSGFSPWFSYNSSRFGYDPFFTHQRWSHRGDRRWEQQVQSNFRNLVQNSDARPPRTWQAQQELNTRSTTSDTRTILATPYDEVVNRKDGRMKFQQIDQSEREKVSQQARNVSKYRAERQKREAQDFDPTDADSQQKRGPVRDKVSESPVIGRSPQESDKDNTTSQKQTGPDFDSKVESKSRQDRREPTERDTPRVNNPQDEPKTLPRRDATPGTTEDPKDVPQRNPSDRSPGQSERSKDTPPRNPADRSPGQSERSKDTPQRNPADRSPGQSERPKDVPQRNPADRSPGQSERSKGVPQRNPAERSPGQSERSNKAPQRNSADRSPKQGKKPRQD